MTGFAGIWNRDGAPVSDEILGRMIGTLRHRGGDGERVVTDGSFGLAVTMRAVTPESIGEEQPCTHRSLTLAFDGRIDNRESLLERCGGVASDSDPMLVARAFARDAETSLGRIIGDFAFALFDSSSNALVLVRDPLGIRPLYYSFIGDTVVFGSEIKALLAHPRIARKPNEEKIAAFLEGGTVDEMRTTFFAGIFSVPPSARVRLTGDGRHDELTYWDFDTGSSIRYRSFEEYAAHFRDLFFNAVRRRLRSSYPVAVSLSGGLDSSSIFCTAEAIRRTGGEAWPKVIGVSYVSPAGSDAGEEEYLDAIESVCDSAVVRFDFYASITRAADEQVLHSEAPDVQFDSYVEMLQRSAGAGARVTMSGYLGDQMMASQDYLVDLFWSLRWRTLWQHMEEQPQWTNKKDRAYLRRWVARSIVRSALSPSLRRLIRRVVSRGTQPENVTRRKQSVFFSRHCRTSYAEGLYRSVRSPYLATQIEYDSKRGMRFGMATTYPFIDRDVVQFLVSIPNEIQAAGGVPRALQREALRGVLPEAIRLRRTKGDFTSSVVDGAVAEYSELAAPLGAGSIARRKGFLIGGVEKPDLTRSLEMAAIVVKDLQRQYALETWLRVFIGEDDERS